MEFIPNPSPSGWAALIVLLPIYGYVVTRMLSAAYFQEKLKYQRDLIHHVK